MTSADQRSFAADGSFFTAAKEIRNVAAVQRWRSLPAMRSHAELVREARAERELHLDLAQVDQDAAEKSAENEG